MPVVDWQFWVVTGVFLAALAWMLKGVLPIPYISARARRRRRQRRVTLTVRGRSMR